MTWQMWSLPNMSEVGNCRFIIDILYLYQSLILCLSCCPSCTKLVVPHYIQCSKRREQNFQFWKLLAVVLDTNIKSVNKVHKRSDETLVMLSLI